MMQEDLVTRSEITRYTTLQFSKHSKRSCHERSKCMPYLLMTPSELHLLLLVEVHARQLTVCTSGSKIIKIKPQLLRN